MQFWSTIFGDLWYSIIVLENTRQVFIICHKKDTFHGDIVELVFKSIDIFYLDRKTKILWLSCNLKIYRRSKAINKSYFSLVFNFNIYMASKSVNFDTVKDWRVVS